MMYIVLSSSRGIVNVFYGHPLTVVSNWVKESLQAQIESLKMTPMDKNSRDISYSIVDNTTEFILQKDFRKVSKGYVYNSSVYTTEHIDTVIIHEYNGEVEWAPEENGLSTNISENINNRVLKQLDKESLFQVFDKVTRLSKTKKSWTRIEYTGMVSYAIKEFKKELYSSIAKKMKRFGKKSLIIAKMNCLSNCGLESKKND